jgi:hypothetical protein
MPVPVIDPVIRIKLSRVPVVAWVVDVGTLAEFINEALDTDLTLLKTACTALRSGEFGAVSDSPVTLPFDGPRNSTIDITMPLRDFLRLALEAAEEIPGAAGRLTDLLTFYQT